MVIASVVKTRSIFAANKEFEKLIAHNKGRPRAVYNYGYIEHLKSGYSVSLSQKKPKSKRVTNLTLLG